MARLTYTAIASLDGYVADRDGNFDWAVPDPEVHAFINSLERSVGTYLYGRRMYQVMAGWESPQGAAGQPPFIQEYAEIWRVAEKVVYSRTLETVTSARTRLLRQFDPEAVRQLKARADQSWPPRPSPPDWWTRSGCSSRRSWWAAARPPSQTAAAWTWSSWMSAASATAWCTSATGPARERCVLLCRVQPGLPSRQPASLQCPWPGARLEGST